MCYSVGRELLFVTPRISVRRLLTDSLVDSMQQSFSQLVGHLPNQRQVEAGNLKDKGDHPKLHADTPRDAARDQLVTGHGVATFCCPRYEVVVNVKYRVVAYEDAVEKCEELNNMRVHEPINHDGEHVDSSEC